MKYAIDAPAVSQNAEDQCFHFTLIASKKPSNLTKCFSLQKGELKKQTSANMVEGNASLAVAKNLADFANILSLLNADQALMYGVLDEKNAVILSRKEYENRGKPAGHTTRTKDAFNWPSGGGVLFGDYDADKAGGKALDKEQLISAIHQAAPGMQNAGFVWWLSSSSLIYNGKEQLTGIKGQRLYWLVKEANDIPRAGKVLVDRLWLAGFGFYEISKAGSLLERCPLDASVWQTNKLDFASGAQCIAPLEQRRGNPEVTDGEVLDTRAALPDLTEQEEAQLASIKQQAKAELRPEVEEVKEAYINERALEIVESEDDAALKHAVQVVRRAVNNKILTGDFPVILESGEAVSIGEILDDPASYHLQKTLDPLEPEYEGRKVVGRLHLIGSRPNLYSFAHGGQVFKLLRQPREIELQEGRRFDAIQETLNLMRELPDVFDMEQQLVTVDQGKSVPIDEQRLIFWLGGNVQYWGWVKKGDDFVRRLFDPNQQIAKQILAQQNARRLKPLDAVITAPVLRPDGSVVNKPGYDPKTRLLLDSAEYMPTIPDAPTTEQVEAALESLMMPFQTFPFACELDKGVFLSALLSAIMRPILPTCPAFGFDAPVQGSGKTLLAKCLGVMATGESPTVWPHTQGRDDEETRKRILTALRSGSRCIVWDNVTGFFDSAAFAAFLTSAIYTDRVLGQSQEMSIPNRALAILTGNNLTLAGDMPRRVLKCRIDPATERPYARSFALDPEQYTKANRQALVAAGLTIIKGWLNSFDANAPGTMASFETWDAFVRQPVAWVSRAIAPGEFADPMDAVDASQTTDPEQEILHDLLSEIRRVMGTNQFCTSDLYKEAYGADFWPGDDELRDALEDVSGKHVSKRSLGRILSFRCDRIVRGLSLTASKDPTTKTSRWRIKDHA